MRKLNLRKAEKHNQISLNTPEGIEDGIGDAIVCL
jgi:hypothetical protein